MWKEKAIGKVQEIRPSQCDSIVRSIEAVVSFKRSESVFRRIARASNTESILDYFAEIRFARIFAGLRFEAEFEPCGEKGPDLRVSRDSQSAYVEVKRFRPSEEDNPAYLSYPIAGSMLVPYGDPEKNIKTIQDKLSEKFRQISAGTGIVAFWSDCLAVEDLEFKSAMKGARIDCESVLQVSPELLFVILGSDWLSAGGQQLYYEAFKPLSEPFATWAQGLTNHHATIL